MAQVHFFASSCSDLAGNSTGVRIVGSAHGGGQSAATDGVDLSGSSGGGRDLGGSESSGNNEGGDDGADDALHGYGSFSLVK